MGWVVGDGKRIKQELSTCCREERTICSREGRKEGRMDYTMCSGTKGLAPRCSRGRELKLGTEIKERLLKTAEVLLLSC